MNEMFTELKEIKELLQVIVSNEEQSDITTTNVYSSGKDGELSTLVVSPETATLVTFKDGSVEFKKLFRN